jgi:uncharacterized membrane protein YeaQ/YmgE (transglycosylase-associated protein family)
MRILSLLWYIIIGFVAGLLGRAVLPGSDKMGLIATTLVGLAGSIIGGLLGNVISKPKPGTKFHPAGLLLSILGAVLVLLVVRFLR